MNRIFLDILTTAMLDSCLVAAQALVLNRLGVPFAAITAFSGIGAYIAALALNGIWSGVYLAVLLILLAVACFSYLERSLPQDQYLLLTLAVLGILRASAGTLKVLGGQIGIASASTWLQPQSVTPYLVLAGVLFAVSFFVHLAIDRSEFGLAVSVTKIAREDVAVRTLVPTRKIMLICFAVAAALAIAAGTLRAMYAGRVDPDEFRIQTAVILLMPTLVVGSTPLRISFFSLAFFMFPGVFGILIGYEASGLAYLRDMTLSVLVIATVARKVTGGSRRAARTLSSQAKG